MSFFGPHGGHAIVFVCLSLTFSIIGSIFSLINIFLILDIKSYKGHILLVLSMAINQFIYDVLLYPASINHDNHMVKDAIEVIQLFTGLAVAFYSNIIATCMLIIIYKRISLSINHNIIFYHSIVMILLIIIIIFTAIIYYLFPNNMNLVRISYFSIRLISILYNLIICIYGYNCIHSIIIFNPNDNNISNININNITTESTRKSIHNNAIYILANRMLYYPIIQIISRSGAIWYEAQYGWNFNPNSVTELQFFVQSYMAIITPMAGVGYCVIYLIMQPKAYERLLYWFNLQPKPVFKHNSVDNPIIPRREVRLSDCTSDSSGTRNTHDTNNTITSIPNNIRENGSVSEGSVSTIETQGYFGHLYVRNSGDTNFTYGTDLSGISDADLISLIDEEDNINYIMTRSSMTNSTVNK